MTTDPEGHPRRRQILAVLCLSLLIVVIDNTILNTALPRLARDLSASTTDLQWVVDAYTLTFAALLIPAGALGDRFGRRTSLLAGLLVFGAGSAAAALSGTTSQVIGFRALMGVGAALVMPSTLSILMTVFPAKERAAAIGVWSAMAGVGIVVGPTLGGYLVQHYSWSAAFWVGVPLVVVAVALVLAVVPHQPGTRSADTRLDVVGAVLASVAMLAVVDAVIGGPNRGWGSGRTLAEFAVGALGLAAFVAWELRTANPMIDVRIFGNRAFSGATLSVALTLFALFGSLFALTQYLQLVKGYSPLVAGLSAMPFAAAVLVLAPTSPLLAKRLGVNVVIPIGLVCMGSGLLLLSLAQPATTYALLWIPVAVMGMGMGLVMAPASESMMSVLPPEQAGVGSAVNDTVQELGGTLGVAVLGSVVSARYAHSIDDSGLPASVTAPARSSITAAHAVAQSTGPRVAELANAGFTDAMGSAFVVAAAVSYIGAVAGFVLLPRRVRPAVTIEDRTLAPVG